MAEFFVSGGKVHKHPRGTECTVLYNGEVLCQEPPKGDDKCSFCFDLQQ